MISSIKTTAPVLDSSLQRELKRIKENTTKGDLGHRSAARARWNANFPTRKAGIKSLKTMTEKDEKEETKKEKVKKEEIKKEETKNEKVKEEKTKKETKKEETKKKKKVQIKTEENFYFVIKEKRFVRRKPLDSSLQRALAATKRNNWFKVTCVRPTLTARIETDSEPLLQERIETLRRNRDNATEAICQRVHKKRFNLVMDELCCKFKETPPPSNRIFQKETLFLCLMGAISIINIANGLNAILS